MSSRLNARQVRMLLAVSEYTRDHGYAPSIRDVARLTGVSSMSIVSYNLDRLVDAGLLLRDAEVSRSFAADTSRRDRGPSGDRENGEVCLMSMSGAYFKVRRRALGLSVRRLSEMFGVSAATVFRWERGEYPVPGMAELAIEQLNQKRKAALHASEGEMSGG